MRSFVYLLAAAVLAAGAASAIGQTTTTYQGRLLSSGQPYTGSADVRFTLFSPSNVAVLGPVESFNVSVVGGTFTTDVNLGDLVTGPGFTLEVAVRTPAGSGTFETLTPRQPVTATPLAANTRGLRVTASGDLGVKNTAPERPIHVGSPNAASEAFLRFSSRAAATLAGRTWDIGVPGMETLPLTNAAYNFVINDVGSGRDPLTNPMFTVQYGTGRVGINTPNPASTLQVNGEARANTLRADTEARAATVVATSNVQTPEVRFSDATTQTTAFRMTRWQLSLPIGPMQAGMSVQWPANIPGLTPLTGTETIIVNWIGPPPNGLILNAAGGAVGQSAVMLGFYSAVNFDYGSRSFTVTIIR